MSYTVEQVNQANKECEVSLGLDPIDTDVQTEATDPLPNMQVPMSDKKNLSWLTLVGLGMLGYFVYKKLKK